MSSRVKGWRGLVLGVVLMVLPARAWAEDPVPAPDAAPPAIAIDPATGEACSSSERSEREGETDERHAEEHSRLFASFT